MSCTSLACELGSLARPGLVDGPSIIAGDVGDIFGRLQPPLDLEARHAHPHQLRDNLERREVLRAEEVADVSEVDRLAIHDDLIGHPASLGALAPVRRPAAEGLARQALAGVGHAEGAVHEDFEGQGGLRRGSCAISPSDNSRARMTREQPSSFARWTPSTLVMDIWVEAWISRSGVRARIKPREAQILDDHGVHPGVDDLADERLDAIQLRREDQRIQGHIAPDAPPMEQGHDFGQFVGLEVGGAGAGVVALESEIDGVGPVLDGRDQARPVPCR